MKEKTIFLSVLFLCCFFLQAHNPWGVKAIYDYHSYFPVINTIIAIVVILVFKFFIIKTKFSYKHYYYIIFFLASWIISYILLILSFHYMVLLTQYFYIDKLVFIIYGFVNISGNFLGSLLIYYIFLKINNRQLFKKKVEAISKINFKKLKIQKKKQIVLIIFVALVFSLVLSFLNIFSRKIDFNPSIFFFIFCIGLVSYYSSVFIVGKISKNDYLIKSKVTSILCLTYILFLFALFAFRLAGTPFLFSMEFEFKFIPTIILLFSGIITIFISKTWSMKFKAEKIRHLAAFFMGVASFYFFIILIGFAVMYSPYSELYIYSGIFIIIMSIILNTLSVLKKGDNSLNENY